MTSLSCTITARVKLLELPERAQEMVGAGTPARMGAGRRARGPLVQGIRRGAEPGRSIRACTEDDVDQARAAGVLIEFEHSATIIVDRKLYRELAKWAIVRTTDGLREQVAAAARPRKQARNQGNDKPEDRVAEARRKESRRLRELAERDGVNLDLGELLPARWVGAVSRSIDGVGSSFVD